jgi:hypothetical protein
MILRTLLRGVVWQGFLSLLGHVPTSPWHGIRPGALALVLLLVQGGALRVRAFCLASVFGLSFLGATAVLADDCQVRCGGRWTCADTNAVVWQQDWLSAETCPSGSADHGQRVVVSRGAQRVRRWSVHRVCVRRPVLPCAWSGVQVEGGPLEQANQLMQQLQQFKYGWENLQR